VSEAHIDQRIPILVYEDIESAFQYLTRVFGLGPGELARAADGSVVHGELQVGDGQLWLHPESEEFGLKSPRNMGGTASGMVVVIVGDVDAHHRHAVEAGATIQYDPTDQEYGYREYSAVDLEGHIWSFMRQID
jgi:MerR family transcriptional regulator, thiopeptide resistance regulator